MKLSPENVYNYKKLALKKFNKMLEENENRQLKEVFSQNLIKELEVILNYGLNLRKLYNYENKQFLEDIERIKTKIEYNKNR